MTKIHKRTELLLQTVYDTCCGFIAFGYESHIRWGKVTCKKCLKHKDVGK